MCVCACVRVSYEAKTRKSKHRSGGEGLLRRTRGARYGSWGRKAQRPGCRSPQEDSEGCIWPPSCQGTRHNRRALDGRRSQPPVWLVPRPASLPRPVPAGRPVQAPLLLQAAPALPGEPGVLTAAGRWGAADRYA